MAYTIKEQTAIHSSSMDKIRSLRKQLRDALAENEELKGRFNQCEKNYKELAKLFFSAEATIERIEAGIKEYLDWPECESCVEDHFRELLEQQE